METKKPKSKAPSKKHISVKEPEKFPIVGIGASAGGLEAFEQLLSNIPENSGMAYVVIQHLDPTQKGMLVELLQRISRMTVYQVKDRMTVKINSVYVIPPNASMSILKGVLHLFKPVESRGLRLPIDFFFRSLADDKKDMAIGIVLSGMGSDGTLGLKAIKENNGIVMVQEPSNAKFDNMPRNAIDSGMVDIVAPAAELPGRLIDLFKRVPSERSGFDVEVKDKSSLDKIIILLRSHTGNDFSLYKKNTIYRRIERRMNVHKIDKIASYVHFLQENPKEIDILFKELLIGVTNFFRDEAVWRKLQETVIPNIISKAQPGSVLRAWVTGCSTGEEAYSLAMVFLEVVLKLNQSRKCTLQIFATDIDPEAIEIARKGFFPANITADVSANRLNRFFVASDDGYRIKPEIREMVVFAQHNIILHPPFTKIDILSCRNLLIYMDHDLQKKLMGLFYYSITPEGILILGNSETLGSQDHLFTPVEGKLKIFKRSISALTPEIFDFPSKYTRSKPDIAERTVTDKTGLNIHTLTDQLLLQYYAPSGVLVNENGDIIYIHGHTGKYLEAAVGKANLNIFAMLREELRNDFYPAFRRAVTKKENVTLHNINPGTNGSSKLVNIDIKWIEKPEVLYGTFLIIFTETDNLPDNPKSQKSGQKAVTRLNKNELDNELQRLRDEMRNTREEVQTSQEELRSANEELQSTNEELQSTNEELTTSKEEMQSLNEELQTLNAELQAKVDDYTRINNDMKNLLNSTEIATLFLDKELKIRSFTHPTTDIFKMIKSDIGRPFTDQVSELLYPALANDAREVLRTLVFIQKEIPARGGRWFLIRIMPYRTFDDRIDGVVITFINISDQKRIEKKLSETENINKILLNAFSGVEISITYNWKIIEFSTKAELFFGINRINCLNKNFIHLLIPEKLQEKTEKSIRAYLKKTVNNTLKLKVKLANGNTEVVNCLLTLLPEKNDRETGLKLSIFKTQNNE